MAFKKATFGTGNPFWNQRELDRIDNMDRPPIEHLASSVYNPQADSTTVYGGHIIWVTAPNYIDNINMYYNDTETSLDATSSTQNTDISAYIPDNLIYNIRGLLVNTDVRGLINGAKTQLNTSIVVAARYSTQYNVTPSIYNVMNNVYCRHTGSDAENATISLYSTVQSYMPITRNNNIPYLTWNVYTNCTTMTSESNEYYGRTYLFLQGFIV